MGVSAAIPPTEVWAGRVPPIVRLSQVTSLDRDGPQIDGEAVLSAIVFSEDAITSAELDERNSDNLQRIIRRQIRAEAKTQLTDDILVAAYQQEGSVRKAAAFLSERTGRMVTKDNVQEALTRSGGAGGLMRQPRKGSG